MSKKYDELRKWTTDTVSTHTTSGSGGTYGGPVWIVPTDPPTTPTPFGGTTVYTSPTVPGDPTVNPLNERLDLVVEALIKIVKKIDKIEKTLDKLSEIVISPKKTKHTVAPTTVFTEEELEELTKRIFAGAISPKVEMK